VTATGGCTVGVTCGAAGAGAGVAVDPLGVSDGSGAVTVLAFRTGAVFVRTAFVVWVEPAASPANAAESAVAPATAATVSRRTRRDALSRIAAADPFPMPPRVARRNETEVSSA
jgi:hypothetical protein